MGGREGREGFEWRWRLLCCLPGIFLETCKSEAFYHMHCVLISVVWVLFLRRSLSFFYYFEGNFEFFHDLFLFMVE